MYNISEVLDIIEYKNYLTNISLYALVCQARIHPLVNSRV